jgi:hypothetical protein
MKDSKRIARISCSLMSIRNRMAYLKEGDLEGAERFDKLQELQEILNTVSLPRYLIPRSDLALCTAVQNEFSPDRVRILGYIIETGVNRNDAGSSSLTSTIEKIPPQARKAHQKLFVARKGWEGPIVFLD